MFSDDSKSLVDTRAGSILRSAILPGGQPTRVITPLGQIWLAYPFNAYRIHLQIRSSMVV
jgi:hypothetical protein